jgi:hypothetical protein
MFKTEQLYGWSSATEWNFSLQQCMHMARTIQLLTVGSCTTKLHIEDYNKYAVEIPTMKMNGSLRCAVCKKTECCEAKK